jgi:hypothetical protein
MFGSALHHCSSCRAGSGPFLRTRRQSRRGEVWPSSEAHALNSQPRTLNPQPAHWVPQLEFGIGNHRFPASDWPAPLSGAIAANA